MKRLNLVLTIMLLVMLSTTGAFAYVSDRHDFGEIDFKGATVTFVTHVDSMLDPFKEGGLYAGRLEEAKELFNIGDIVVETADYFDVGEAAFNRYLAGDSQYDFWLIPQGWFWDLASHDAFYPVSEFLPEAYFETLPPIVQAKNEALRINGQKFHFSSGGADDYSNAKVMVVNLDIFERDNLGDPFELYLNNEWTWETVEAIARKATRDTTGDGQIDQWGLMKIGVEAMIMMNGGVQVREEDGYFKFTMDEPEVIEALRTYYKWHFEENFTIGDWQQIEFPAGYVAMMLTDFWTVGGTDTPYDFPYAVLPPPMGPHVDDYVYTPGGTVIMSPFIPKNAAYPEGMVALDNFLFRLDEYWDRFDEQCVAKAPDRISYEVLRNVVEKTSPVGLYHDPILGNEWAGDLPFGAIVAGVHEGRPPATVVNEVKAQAQAILDELYGQK